MSHNMSITVNSLHRKVDTLYHLVAELSNTSNPTKPRLDRDIYDLFLGSFNYPHQASHIATLAFEYMNQLPEAQYMDTLMQALGQFIILSDSNNSPYKDYNVSIALSLYCDVNTKYHPYVSQALDNPLFPLFKQLERENYPYLLFICALTAYYLHLKKDASTQADTDTAAKPEAAPADPVGDILNTVRSRDPQTWQEILQLLERKGYLQSPSGGGKVEVHGKEEIPSNAE